MKRFVSVFAAMAVLCTLAIGADTSASECCRVRVKRVRCCVQKVVCCKPVKVRCCKATCATVCPCGCGQVSVTPTVTPAVVAPTPAK